MEVGGVAEEAVDLAVGAAAAAAAPPPPPLPPPAGIQFSLLPPRPLPLPTRPLPT